MKYAFLLKYKVNYKNETKYRLFYKIENAINFYNKYNKLNDVSFSKDSKEKSLITHYEILVIEFIDKDLIE